MAIPEFYLKEIDQGGALVGLLIGLVVTATGFVTGMVYAIVVGVVMTLYAGLKLANARPRAKQLMPAPEFRSLVRVHPLPFWVCIRCHAMHEYDAKGCLNCDGRADYLEVTSEEDRRTALVAMGEE